MPVDGVGRSSSDQYVRSQGNQMAEDKTTLSISDFYKLLAAQLKYQDADNPMNTSEMMAQMVQTQMVDAINTMSTVSTTTYAASMIGKEITVAELDDKGQFTGDKTSGVVTGVILGSPPIVYVDEKPYFLSQIMVIGKEPPPKEDKPEDGGGTGGDSNEDEADKTPKV